MVAVVNRGMREDWPDEWSPILKDIAKVLGMDIYPTESYLRESYSAPSQQWFCGDMQTLFVNTSQHQWLILHDIGHWIAAAPWERKRNNFELDTWGPSRSNKKRARWRWASASKVEIDACKIHFAMMQKAGYSWEEVVENASSCNFFNSGSPVTGKSDKAKEAYLRRLIAHGKSVTKRRAPGVYKLLWGRRQRPK
jgi:hypothetical protein